MTGRQIKLGLIIGAIIIIVPIVILALFRKQIFSAILKQEQKKFIDRLHYKSQNKLKKFIARVEKETEYNIIVTSSYIPWSEQQKLHEADPKKPAAGSSLSNYGLSITINAINGTSFLRKSSKKSAWEKSKIPDIASKLGIKWGGLDDSNYNPVYFDLSGEYNVDTLKNIALNQFPGGIEDVKGNEVKIPNLLRRIKA